MLEAPLDDIASELDTNMFGIIRVSRAFANTLGRHARSSIVNVLSVQSWLAAGSGYEISKAAASSATNAIRLRLDDQRTIVTSLHVGLMDTDLTRNLHAPKSDPRDIARATVDAILTGDYEVLADAPTRQVKELLCGDLTRLYPRLNAAWTSRPQLQLGHNLLGAAAVLPGSGDDLGPGATVQPESDPVRPDRPSKL